MKFGFESIKERHTKNELELQLNELNKDKEQEPPEWDNGTELGLELKLKRLQNRCKKAKQILLDYKKNRPKKNKTKKTIPLAETSTQTKPEEISANVTEETLFEPAKSEPVFNSNFFTEVQSKKEILLLEDKYPQSQGESLVHSFDERTRNDLAMQIIETTYRVETVQNPITGESVTAKVDDGPFGFQVTWNAINKLIGLVTGCGIPIVRLSSMLSSKTNSYFSPSTIYRLLLYAAKGLSSVYLEIGKQVAQCDIINYDDTSTLVLGMKESTNSDDQAPCSENTKANKKFCIKDSLEETDPQKVDFLQELTSFLGGQQPYKNGKDLKKAVYTTVLIGKSRANLKSESIFYYSERKTAGDLLGKLFTLAYPNSINENYTKKQLVLQSDLSANNLPCTYPSHLEFIIAGCCAHARRPFWRYREDSDPEIGYYCYTLLLQFEQIADLDRDSRSKKDSEKLLKERKAEQLPKWLLIKQLCEEIMERFAPNSSFYNAAEYCVAHYEKLTRYIYDPALVPDNNKSERLLRYEKIMLDNSHFRKSKTGRLVYDILRTILVNCSCLGISFEDYLPWILKNQIEARKKPEEYTPHAYAKLQVKVDT